MINRKGSRIQWNDTFGQAALDYRFAPELCTPRRGQEKGSAETATRETPLWQVWMEARFPTPTELSQSE